MNVRAMVDALELWRESIDDCRELDLDRLLPGLGPAPGHAGQTARADRRPVGITHWLPITPPDTDDSSLVETLALDLERSACTELSHCAARSLHELSGAVTDSRPGQPRAVADHAGAGRLGAQPGVSSFVAGAGYASSPHGGIPSRLIHALFPPAAFIAAFFFWVLMYPPPGPKVPMIAAILALVILRTPMNPLPLLAVFVVEHFVCGCADLFPCDACTEYRLRSS